MVFPDLQLCFPGQVANNNNVNNNPNKNPINVNWFSFSKDPGFKRQVLMSLLISNYPRLSKAELQFTYFGYPSMHTFELDNIVERRYYRPSSLLKEGGLNIWNLGWSIFCTSIWREKGGGGGRRGVDQMIGVNFFKRAEDWRFCYFSVYFFVLHHILMTFYGLKLSILML